MFFFKALAANPLSRNRSPSHRLSSSDCHKVQSFIDSSDVLGMLQFYIDTGAELNHGFFFAQKTLFVLPFAYVLRAFLGTPPKTPKSKQIWKTFFPVASLGARPGLRRCVWMPEVIWMINDEL